MIFYFTGTGNSLYVAQHIREVTGDHAISMADCLLEDDLDYKMYMNERIGFVFPTHCWGTPWLVDQFLDKLTIRPSDGYGDDTERLDSTFVFAVITCGSSIGNADKMLEKKLAKKGISVNAICPGYFYSPLTRETLDSEFFQANAKTMIPMERYGDEGELDTAAIFLASPATTYVTGVMLPVDGGYTSM